MQQSISPPKIIQDKNPFGQQKKGIKVARWKIAPFPADGIKKIVLLDSISSQKADDN